MPGRINQIKCSLTLVAYKKEWVARCDLDDMLVASEWEQTKIKKKSKNEIEKLCVCVCMRERVSEWERKREKCNWESKKNMLNVEAACTSQVMF